MLLYMLPLLNENVFSNTLVIYVGCNRAYKGFIKWKREQLVHFRDTKLGVGICWVHLQFLKVSVLLCIAYLRLLGMFDNGWRVRGNCFRFQTISVGCMVVRICIIFSQFRMETSDGQNLTYINLQVWEFVWGSEWIEWFQVRQGSSSNFNGLFILTNSCL